MVERSYILWVWLAFFSNVKDKATHLEDLRNIQRKVVGIFLDVFNSSVSVSVSGLSTSFRSVVNLNANTLMVACWVGCWDVGCSQPGKNPGNIRGIMDKFGWSNQCHTYLPKCWWDHATLEPCFFSLPMSMQESHVVDLRPNVFFIICFHTCWNILCHVLEYFCWIVGVHQMSEYSDC